MDAGTPSKKPRTVAASVRSPWKVKTSVASSVGQFATPEKMKKVAAAALDLVTPEKTKQRPLLRRGRSGGAVALSVKEVRRAALELHRAAPSSAGPSYEILCEFFNCFESSTRLLRMKGSKATFPNICASIRNLAERRFTYGHLAQLKYIMPEAMVQRVHASIVVNSLGTYYIDAGLHSSKFGCTRSLGRRIPKKTHSHQSVLAHWS
ncbi:hypothetical protein ZWY2020_040769 [Hordeum vulgare]|nr:hypothetical protein ZWY2020_040769 [Hordeum vulgare]